MRTRCPGQVAKDASSTVALSLLSNCRGHSLPEGVYPDNLGYIIKQMITQGDSPQSLSHTKRLGNLQFLGYLKSQPETVHTIFSIEKYLQNHPAFYLDSLLVLLKGRQLQQIKERITQQYQQLMSGSSFLHRINASIEARNKCINKIRRDISKAAHFLVLFQQEYFDDNNDDAVYLEWVQAEGYSAIEVDTSIEHSIQLLSAVFSDMYRLRDMTIYVVESIHRWRMELEEHSDRCQQHSPIHFFYSDKDVYQTILEDTDFIWRSKLSSYIWMQAKQDPFFIRNVIHIQERQSKTPLEKYFLQFLYPKEEIIIEKSLKCFEMLFFKFKPKLANRFEEEELLIQNYLKLEMDSHQFDQEYHTSDNLTKQATNQSLITKSEQIKPQKQLPSPDKKSRLNIRGWVFEKSPMGKSRQKVNKIVQNHKEKLNIIKTFNIAHQAQRNSIALAYLSQTKPTNKPSWSKQALAHRNSRQREFFSEGEEYKQEQRQKHVESEPEVRLGTESRMFKSLSKLHPVILQDPKEHLPDTPKNNQKVKQNLTIPTKTSQVGRQPSFNQIKLNSFQQKIQLDDKIQVQEEETPLNMKQFFEVFRADTNKTRRKELGESKRQGEAQKVISIKNFLQNARKQRAKSLYLRKPPILTIKKRKLQPQVKQKLDKSSDSYKQFTKIEKQGSNAAKIATQLKGKDVSSIFLSLKAKSVPYDLIIPYMKHVSGQQHTTSHSFTDFKTVEVLNKLADPFIHCIIFDVFSDKQQHLGQVILSESISGRGGKLKYLVQLMNIHVFQYVISVILRVSEQLLATSPCQQVIFPLILNKNDIVSAHFVELIDAALREHVVKFGKMTILQKTRVSHTTDDIRDRLYVFTSQSNLKKQYELGIKMMGNYRSLQFQVKCLVMCSNFRLRSKSLFKDTLRKYRSVCLGELYVQIMSKILTKYHLKQLKAASYSIDSEDDLSELLKKDLFVKNIMHNLMNYLKEQRSEELLMMTAFGTMNELLHYLRYKKHDLHFDFQFLEESRFILNHQLILSQFDQDVSMDFSLTSNDQIYVLHNHKQLSILMVSSRNIPLPLYLLPTANQKLKIFFMSASDYQNSSQEMDLFSYINFFLRETHFQTNLNEVPAVVLPNLKKKQTKLSAVRMYDGFFKLFPEREFYSAARMTCFNHWESYYPPAVIHTPKETSIVIDFPFIVGFYDAKHKYPLTAFLYGEEGQRSP